MLDVEDLHLFCEVLVFVGYDRVVQDIVHEEVNQLGRVCYIAARCFDSLVRFIEHSFELQPLGGVGHLDLLQHMYTFLQLFQTMVHEL